MSSESLYKKADRADDIGDVDVKDADPKALMSTLYSVLLDSTKDMRKRIWYDVDDYDVVIEKIARMLVRPFRKNFRGELIVDGDDMQLRERYVEYEHMEGVAGSLLSALLNDTDVKKLVVRNMPHGEKGIGVYNQPYASGIGENLREGKTLEIAEGVITGGICSHSSGGAAINRGTVTNCIGYDCTGGKYLNLGEASDMGSHCSGGLWINRKKVRSDMGVGAKGGFYVNFGEADRFGGDYAYGGTFLNHGTTRRMGDFPYDGVYLNFGEVKQLMGWKYEGGVFVTRNDPGVSFMQESIEKHVAYGAGPRQLKRDSKLSGLMDMAEKASLKGRFNESESLVRKIDAHVRKTYRPRRVA